jgi:hypothetical protein
MALFHIQMAKDSTTANLFRSIFFPIPTWPEENSKVDEVTGKSSLTISANPVGVGAVSQPLIPTGEQSSLLMRIATTINASLCVRTKS